MDILLTWRKLETMRIGIYPGSFDPLTYGHLDVIERSQILCDKLIIAVAINSAKNCLFTMDERLDLIKKATENSNTDIEVVSFDGLLAAFCEQNNVSFIIRGLRSTVDYEYEKPIAAVNVALYSHLETVFLMTRDEYSSISSNIVRELASYKGDVSRFVPQFVAEAIQSKYSKN
jgi:pantetheine-phosphate adenylyltransferase